MKTIKQRSEELFDEALEKIMKLRNEFLETNFMLDGGFEIKRKVTDIIVDSISEASFLQKNMKMLHHARKYLKDAGVAEEEGEI